MINSIKDKIDSLKNLIACLKQNGESFAFENAELDELSFLLCELEDMLSNGLTNEKKQEEEIDR